MLKFYKRHELFIIQSYLYQSVSFLEQVLQGSRQILEKITFFNMKTLD